MFSSIQFVAVLDSVATRLAPGVQVVPKQRYTFTPVAVVGFGLVQDICTPTPPTHRVAGVVTGAGTVVVYTAVDGSDSSPGVRAVSW